MLMQELVEIIYYYTICSRASSPFVIALKPLAAASGQASSTVLFGGAQAHPTLAPTGVPKDHP
jgi:hypothetical protein